MILWSTNTVPHLSQRCRWIVTFESTRATVSHSPFQWCWCSIEKCTIRFL